MWCARSAVNFSSSSIFRRHAGHLLAICRMKCAQLQICLSFVFPFQNPNEKLRKILYFAAVPILPILPKCGIIGSDSINCCWELNALRMNCIFTHFIQTKHSGRCYFYFFRLLLRVFFFLFFSLLISQLQTALKCIYNKHPRNILTLGGRSNSTSNNLFQCATVWLNARFAHATLNLCLLDNLVSKSCNFKQFTID